MSIVNKFEKFQLTLVLIGAFYPFFRNHDEYGSLSQEFYRWPLVAEAARKAIHTRLRLLDYLYTAMYKQNQTGSPTINPVFFLYPEDSKTFEIEHQFFFGESILVSPVLEPNQTSVRAYMPDDIFYDFTTFKSIRGRGDWMTFGNVPYTKITAHIKGGSIIPMRAKSANTTMEVRKQNYTVLVAPGLDGTASGSLYIDDGDSLVQPAISNIQFSYSKSGKFSMSGVFDYDAGVSIESIVLLDANKTAGLDSRSSRYDSTARTLTHDVNIALRAPVVMSL